MRSPHIAHQGARSAPAEAMPDDGVAPDAGATPNDGADPAAETASADRAASAAEASPAAGIGVDEEVLHRLRDHAAQRGFTMSSERVTGELLAVLGSSKANGRILELGTGVGNATLFLLAGLGPQGRIVTVENDPELHAVAREVLDDPRIDFQLSDAREWILQAVERGERFDLVFADTWEGKFFHREEAMSLVSTGGFYVIDDLLPQPGWPENHDQSVEALVADLSSLPGWRCVHMPWASGLMVCCRLD